MEIINKRMRPKKIINVFALIVTVSLFSYLSGCHSPDPNPCSGLSPFKAKFEIKEVIGLGDTALVTDTVFSSRAVQFGASDNYTTYLWQVGNDPRIWNTKSFSLYFDVLGNLPVTLVAQGKLNKTCFPMDDGIDTLVKVFN